MIIGDRWKVAILQNLMSGLKSFSDLKQSIRYVSHRVLLEELAELEAAGVLNAQIYQKVPFDADYSLTPKGDSLRTVFESMQKWVDTYQ